ncbi:replication initiation factor RepA [Fictibacillus macauensis ZFHKF-1]|uniref:Replication initiation factor RepA n=1 Tax=Fictibacillus macauensis ZFHKF-1 TaxID=1196324 RepID=I8J2L7_9BACL|nr:DnaA N-terminal domain-containing protein [Fictibacillus macauensis]EIT85976.1 replication initiation factor RepA [Fictibacillus macauensis ZFHKF-1]
MTSKDMTTDPLLYFRRGMEDGEDTLVYFKEEDVQQFTLESTGVPLPRLQAGVVYIDDYFMDYWMPVLGLVAGNVYLHLLRPTAGERACIHDEHTLAAKLGINEEALEEAFNTLEAFGFIFRFWKASGEGGPDVIFKVRQSVPLLDPLFLDMIPEVLQQEHEQFIGRLQQVYGYQLAQPIEEEEEEQEDQTRPEMVTRELPFEEVKEPALEEPTPEPVNEEVVKVESVEERVETVASSTADPVVEPLPVMEKEEPAPVNEIEEVIEEQSTMTEQEQKVWNLVLQALADKLPKPSMDTWFTNSYCKLNENERMATIHLFHAFENDWVQTRYHDIIASQLKKQFGNGKIDYVIHAE